MIENFLFQSNITLFYLLVIVVIPEIILIKYIANKFNFKIPTTSYISKKFDKNKIKKILNDSENLNPTLKKCIQIILFLNKILNTLTISFLTVWGAIILIAITN
jgi:ABC-type maltose transport system permease subunit